jgi:hypothetical protein
VIVPVGSAACKALQTKKRTARALGRIDFSWLTI